MPDRRITAGFSPPITSFFGGVDSQATTLEVGQLYHFWIELGDLTITSMSETHSVRSNIDASTQVQITVALFSFDNEIIVTPGTDVGELLLKSDGTVSVIRQPMQITPGQNTFDPSSHRLFFPIRTPGRTGTFRLRCCLYYQQVLIQSHLIHVRITPKAKLVRRPVRLETDYILSKSLSPTQLAYIKPHRLSIMVNSNSNSTHGFRFWGEQQFKHDTCIDEHTAQHLIMLARGALRRAAWGDEKPWNADPQSYRYIQTRSLTGLTEDLIYLASRGYRLYDAIINQLGGNFEKAEALADLMRRPGFVQLAMKQNARFVVPIALFYDYPFDTNAPLSDITLCPTFSSALQSNTPLEDCPCFQGECPSREEEKIICPSGFWGYRHYLGTPLSRTNLPEGIPVILFQRLLECAMSVSTDPILIKRLSHEEALHILNPSAKWNYAATREATFALLKALNPHLVYFYCHGGITPSAIPYICVGAPGEPEITRDNLRSKRIRWKQTHPLVFINGCHTTALEPDIALDLVSGFIENADASGVIGTEITIFESLACGFAEQFLKQFFRGSSVGEAIRNARLALLKEHNPLGLVYVPFTLASLCLVEQPVSPTQLDPFGAGVVASALY